MAECLNTNLLNNQQWDLFLREIKLNSSVREITKGAWERCAKLGIDPNRPDVIFLSHEALNKLLEDNKALIEAAKIYIKYLSDTLSGIPNIILLSNFEGWIIEMTGLVEEFGGRDKGIALGANWSEECIGNNGVGSTLKTKEATLVYGPEHYIVEFQNNACFGVPIFNHDKCILGVFEISVPCKYANPAIFALMQACGHSIENLLNRSEQLNNKMDWAEKLAISGGVVSTAFHDIKNYLTVIRGSSQLGYLANDLNVKNEYFNRIIEQIDTLVDKLDELLLLNKNEIAATTSPSDLIETLIEEISNLCEIKNINVTYKKEGDINLLLYENQFKRAIYNILSNSIKAMPNGGDIELMVSKDKEFFSIVIKDQGLGIPPEFRDKIFEPFFSGWGDSTGLGLYMVHHTITRLHKGQIWFESETGKGTTFYIKIPIKIGSEKVS